MVNAFLFLSLYRNKYCSEKCRAVSVGWQKLRDSGGVSSPRPSDSWTQTQPLNINMTPLINHLTISKIFIILYLILTVSFAHSTFCVLVFFLFFFFFLVLLLHDNHVQPVCTFLSCTFLLILIFKSTVYCHAHFLYFVLYILFFTYFILCIFPLCLYSIIFALSMERTWLTFHCWLYTLYIIVYVTNKNLESLGLFSSCWLEEVRSECTIVVICKKERGFMWMKWLEKSGRQCITSESSLSFD